MMTMTIDNNLRDLDILIDKIVEFLYSQNIHSDTIKDIQLITEEIVSNIIKYGYDDGQNRSIIVTLKIDNGLIVEIFEDYGHPFNPFTHQINHDLSVEVEDIAIGGLGILLVKELADYVKYDRHDHKNIIKIAKTCTFQ